MSRFWSSLSLIIVVPLALVACTERLQPTPNLSEPQSGPTAQAQAAQRSQAMAATASATQPPAAFGTEVFTPAPPIPTLATRTPTVRPGTSELYPSSLRTS